HPLNRPVIDGKTCTIAHGYGALVPNVQTRRKSVQHWRFPHWLCGPTASEDDEATATRTFLFDFFDRMHYPGKGLHDIRAYRTVCTADRLPDETILSHDTIEGAWLRCGFAGRVTITDGFPSTYLRANERRHRWIRGDWQNLLLVFRQIIGLPA